MSLCVGSGGVLPPALRARPGPCGAWARGRPTLGATRWGTPL